jgi:hypothetical protein
MEHIEAARIEVARVPDAERINFLPRHFGRQMLIVERAVFAHLENLCADYRRANRAATGFWSKGTDSRGFSMPIVPASLRRCSR